VDLLTEILNPIPANQQEYAPAASAQPMTRRSAAIGIAIVLHSVILWLLAFVIRPSLTSQLPHELQVAVVATNIGVKEAPAPPVDWKFETPETPLIPVPDITIVPDQGDGGIVADTITRQLGPRLDPGHVNQRPELPHTLGDLVKALSLELRILVQPDGSVGQAQVIRSTGTSDIDRLAIEWVQNTWHYLPASVNDKPIAAWTTVIVRFAPF